MWEDNFVILFSSIKKKMYKLLNNKLKDYNLSIIEAIYLIILYDEKSLTFKELTTKAECDKGMTTKVLVKLKMMGYVTYNIKNIEITDKGKITGTKIKNILKELRNNLNKKIGEKELKNIYKELSDFNNILEGELKC